MYEEKLINQRFHNIVNDIRFCLMALIIIQRSICDLQGISLKIIDFKI